MTTHTSTAKNPRSAPERFAHLGGFDLTEVAGKVLPYTGTHPDHVLAELTVHVGRLDDLFSQVESHQAVDRYLAEAGEWEERLDRYAVLHTMDLAVGSKAQPTRWPGWVPSDPNLSKRPLRPLELALSSLIARSSIGRTVLVAVAMAGADSVELAAILPSALSVHERRITGEIALPGGRPRAPDGLNSAPRRPGPTPPRYRMAALPSWSLPAVQERLDGASFYADVPLLYTGRSTSPEKIQSSLLMNLNAILRMAGLSGDPTVSPLSIRNGAALARYRETGNIEEVDTMLGYGDLNLTQRHIGLRPGLVKRKR